MAEDADAIKGTVEATNEIAHLVADNTGKPVEQADDHERNDMQPLSRRKSPGPAAASGNLSAPVQMRPPPPQTAFDRKELMVILNAYGRGVAAGEWRDYAIDHLKDQAVFSIFRRSSEMPIYRVIKQPKLARKQGAYSIVAPTGLILKRGHDLSRVLRVIDKSLKLVEA